MGKKFCSFRMCESRRLIRSSRPTEIFQPPQQGFLSVHAHSFSERLFGYWGFILLTWLGRGTKQIGYMAGYTTKKDQGLVWGEIYYWCSVRFSICEECLTVLRSPTLCTSALDSKLSVRFAFFLSCKMQKGMVEGKINIFYSILCIHYLA